MVVNIENEKSKIYTCPFCGKVHFAPEYINVICECGAKRYFNAKKWLNRITGEWKEDIGGNKNETDI